MRRLGLLCSAGLIAAACHEYRTDPKRAPSAPPASATTTKPSVPVPEWVAAVVDRPGDTLAPTPKNPDGGALIQGQRVGPSGSTATQVAAPALTGGARVPKHLGGGFLFWNASALYFARTFVAGLEPVVGVEAPVARASFGPDYVLVHHTNGARFALGWPGRRPAPLPVAGLIDVAALGDGRALLLVEPDLLLTRGSGQKSWREASAQGLTRLVATDDELWLERQPRAASRLEADGTLSSHPALPDELTKPSAEPSDPRWPTSVREAPLTRAVRRGIPLDERTALVDAAGAFARVSLPEGKLSSIGPAVVAGSLECELLPVEGDVLGLCRTQSSKSVISGAAGPTPKLERAFPSAGRFYSGSVGTLLFAGACDGRTTSTPSVCVRQRDGSWRELGDGGRTADAGAPAPAVQVSRWVPTRDGGAVGLVRGAQGGLYNPATGELARFTVDQHQYHGGLFSASGELLSDELAMSEDGRIVGYADRNGVVLHADGRVEPSAHAFQSLSSAGALALASDRENRLWQSNDFGRHWVEVARPPGTDLRTGVNVQRCSRVGCEATGWYRLGYRPSTPTAFRSTTAPKPALLPKQAAPRLVCERTSPPRTRWVTRAVDTNGSRVESFDFGARKVRGREDELGAIGFAFEGDEPLVGASLVERALAESAVPGASTLIDRARVLRFADPLGDPKVVESRFSWQDVLMRAEANMRENVHSLSEITLEALPVLAEKPGSSAGILGRTPLEVGIWARAGERARIIALGPENMGYEPVSAVARGKDELVVLAEDDSCAARVFSVTNAGARTLLELPSRPTRQSCPLNRDALALAEDGTPAVLRMPSSDLPSSDDPALLLRPGQKPLSLAPWSTLSACGADRAGARALVVVRRRWIELSAPGLAQAESELVLAVVRWSERQLCAELVGVAAAALEIGDQSLPTLAMARFGNKPSADRRGFALGAEHGEDLACKLGR